MLLLFGAGLLLRTLLAVENVDRGYRAEQASDDDGRPAGSAVSHRAIAAAVLRGRRAGDHGTSGRAQRGLDEHAAAGRLRRRIGSSSRSWATRQCTRASARPPTTRSSSPAYFQTLDLPIVAGRGFDDRDTGGSVAVCIVNEAFVRGHLQGRSPIGVRVALRPTGSPQEPPVVREIVGVARQVKGRPGRNRGPGSGLCPDGPEPRR